VQPLCDLDGMKLALVAVLSIVHVMQGCHVWATNDGRPLGATRTMSVAAGSRVSIRISCPMDFDVVETAGPKLELGDSRWHTGTAHTLVFKRRGVYRLEATNVQSPEEVGLQVMGTVNVLHLVVRVR
jgi:hypothetical protein